MENLENFRNEFKKCESIKNLFDREWCYAIRIEKNANIFKTLYADLARNLVKNLPKPPLKFNTDKTMMLYKKLHSNLEKFRTCLY